MVGSVVVIAAHGGCGASTLVAALAAQGWQTREVDVASAITEHRAHLQGSPPLRLVVAAATADGTALAASCLHRLTAELPSAPLHLVLVLVRDGRGPIPVAARARIRLLSPHVGGVHVVPYVQRWRYETAPDRTPARGYAAAVARLTARLASSGAVQPATTRQRPQPATAAVTRVEASA